jgi:hypothetical protein
MKLALAIFQGLGLATAAGIRPFLPALLAGALASADLGVDFDGTGYAFLEAPWFLLLIVVALVVAVVLTRRDPAAATGTGPVGAAIAGLGIGLGALLFAGSLADIGEPSWPGLIGGVLAGLLAQGSVFPLLRRAAARLDAAARAALPVYADGAALLLAGLAVLVPPIAVLVAIALVVLLIRGRGRDDQKYAGLRILR